MQISGLKKLWEGMESFANSDMGDGQKRTCCWAMANSENVTAEEHGSESVSGNIVSLGCHRRLSANTENDITRCAVHADDLKEKETHPSP